MNRIVIIGNGFDIAHGLPTGYKEFITYLKNEYIEIIKEGSHDKISNHRLFYLTPAKAEMIPDSMYVISTDVTLIDQITSWENLTKNVNLVYALPNRDDLLRFETQVSIKNKLLAYAFNQSKINTWGGFENDYKDILVNLIKDEYRKYSSSYFPSSYTAEDLNRELSEIISELYIYLKNNIQVPSGINAKIFNKLYTQPLTSWRMNNSEVSKYGNIDIIANVEKPFDLANILFVSFNYTHTIQKYLLNGSNKRDIETKTNFDFSNNRIQTSIRYIHGNLIDNEADELIFGYGDELDEHQSILETKENEFLKHIKSVLYTRNAYYREIVDFADADDFDVIVYGHSCSNTDRTLLNTLFEHDRCISIQPFLHDKRDTSIYTNIYRCFREKKKMRSKVVDQTNTINGWT